MRVTSLKLANLRAIEAAQFRFRSGFNLNGTYFSHY